MRDDPLPLLEKAYEFKAGGLYAFRIARNATARQHNDITEMFKAVSKLTGAFFIVLPDCVELVAAPIVSD